MEVVALDLTRNHPALTLHPLNPLAKVGRIPPRLEHKTQGFIPMSRPRKTLLLTAILAPLPRRTDILLLKPENDHRNYL